MTTTGTHAELGGGWPDIAGDTALTLKVPAADPLVRTAAPAHVTVLYPFLHESRLDGAVHAELARLFGAHDAFEVTFAEFGRFPGVLFLEPLPKDPVTALTKEITRRWPEAEPYRGVFGGGLEPHLTLAVSEVPYAEGAFHDALEAELAPALPVTARIAAVHLIAWDGAQWRDRAVYELGRAAE